METFAPRRTCNALANRRCSRLRQYERLISPWRVSALIAERLALAMLTDDARNYDEAQHSNRRLDPQRIQVVPPPARLPLTWKKTIPVVIEISFLCTQALDMVLRQRHRNGTQPILKHDTALASVVAAWPSPSPERWKGLAKTATESLGAFRSTNKPARTSGPFFE
jgi:hypothetical protein